MATMKDFLTKKRANRTLPVIVLLDTSGSMADYGKIDTLNEAVDEMLAQFKAPKDLVAGIRICIITFGARGARVHTPLMSACDAEWTHADAEGGTPMGAAFCEAAAIIEDRGQVSSDAYRPMVIVVTDGQPTDSVSEGFRRLVHGKRASKADRMAMAIGADADKDMLRQFLEGTPHEVFHAEDASDITSFFELVTITVLTRSRSVNPDDIVEMDSPEDVNGY